jgi:hypothetical protein
MAAALALWIVLSLIPRPRLIPWRAAAIAVCAAAVLLLICLLPQLVFVSRRSRQATELRWSV